MGRIAEITFVTDLHDSFISRNQHKARIFQPLLQKPFVRRFFKLCSELFLKRAYTYFALSRQFLDRNIIENIIVNNLSEIIFIKGNIPQQFASDTGIFFSENKIQQFRNHNYSRRFITADNAFIKISVQRAEKCQYSRSRLFYDKFGITILANMGCINIRSEIRGKNIQVLAKLFRFKMDQYLFKFIMFIRNIFNIISSFFEINYLSRRYSDSFIAIINKLFPFG